MTKQPTFYDTIYICNDCLFYLLQDEQPREMSNIKYLAFRENIEKFFPKKRFSLVPINNTAFFSTVACDYCRDDLPGKRHKCDVYRI